MTKEQIENSFTYHAPKGTQQERYVALREKAKELAFMLLEMVPPSREQSLAFTKLEECIMVANKGIACNE
jgi:short-subunit dehydrogenase involved in D-alanine esterification of teichoic acids